MGAELGATTSMFPADERMATYLRATGRGELVPLDASSISDLLEPDPEVEADPEKYYDRVVELDLSDARAARRRPAFARPRAADLRSSPPRSRDAEQRLRRRDLRGADRQLHQLVLRGHEPRGRRRRAGEGARHQGRRAAAGHAGLGAGARHHRARRADAVARRTSAAPCSRTPAARASASGAGRARQPARAEHDRHVVQPQLPAAQRRPGDDDELHRQPRDRDRARARGHACRSIR